MVRVMRVVDCEYDVNLKPISVTLVKMTERNMNLLRLCIVKIVFTISA